MPQPYPHGELLIVIDCADLDRSAAFWSAVLGYTASPAATGPYRSLEPESGAGIDVLLQRVSDAVRFRHLQSAGVGQAAPRRESKAPLARG